MGAGLHTWTPTSFEGTTEPSFWQKEEEVLDMSPDADNLPLCEDLNAGAVGNGDSCWSTCSGQCPNDVLKPGLAFDFDEVGPGHPGCTSHFECVGNKDRILCHALKATEECMPAAASALVEALPWPRGDGRRILRHCRDRDRALDRFL
mmetsp:Transcript_83100/g.185495  ORF Transcript_83100/g.185495 Transcript_83100/m.185495 type:complete len:148 (-) Transcript_83100:91-534(-)